MASPFESIVQAAAAKFGVDPALVMKMIQAESNGNPAAVSPRGAQGLMQLMPDTAKSLGVNNPLDPTENINGGTQYISQLMKRFGGDRRKALGAYNFGPTNVDAGKEFPPETLAYLEKILGKQEPAPSQDPTPFDPAASLGEPAVESPVRLAGDSTNRGPITPNQPTPMPAPAPGLSPTGPGVPGAGPSGGGMMRALRPIFGPATANAVAPGEKPAGMFGNSMLPSASSVGDSITQFARKMVPGAFGMTPPGAQPAGLPTPTPPAAATLPSPIAPPAPTPDPKLDFGGAMDPTSGQPRPDGEVPPNAMRARGQSMDPVQMMLDHMSSTPKYEDYKPSLGRKIAAGLTTGLLAGASNDPTEAIAQGQHLLNGRYERAMATHHAQGENLKDIAKVADSAQDNALKERGVASMEKYHDAMGKASTERADKYVAGGKRTGAQKPIPVGQQNQAWQNAAEEMYGSDPRVRKYVHKENGKNGPMYWLETENQGLLWNSKFSDADQKERQEILDLINERAGQYTSKMVDPYNRQSGFGVQEQP